MATPTPTQLYFFQGATLRLALSYQPDGAASPIDYTGYTARLQVRPSVDSATIYLSLTTENGGIVISGTQVMLTATAAATLAYGFGDKNQGVYDLEMVSPTGKVSKPFFGLANLIRAITK